MTSTRVPTIPSLALAIVTLLPGSLVAAQSAVTPETTQAGERVQALSLEEALRRAESQSEEVGIARAGASRASGEELRARSQFFPQISASAGYVRTFKSQFDVLRGNQGGEPAPPSALPAPCGQYLRDAGASIDERVAGVETATRCSLARSLFDSFGDLPFGQKNQYDLGLQLSQSIYSGGRVSASHDVARSARRSADVELAARIAAVKVEVTEAYYDAALADRLVQIAESSLAQTEEALRLTELAREIGEKSEFELLRARVTRDNQRPILIQRRGQRDIAYLRLRHLLDLPFDTQVTLTTGIQDENIVVGGVPAGADTAAASRSTVRIAAEAVSAQESLLRVQRSERLPSVSLTSQYGRVGYPDDLLPRWNDFRDNFTIGVGVQLPIFSGGRLRGSEIVARANVDEARHRLQRASELASLDSRSTLASLRQAEEEWRASLGTAEEAQRAYDIAQIRFREGVSTPLELSESRVLLQQAQANRAIAARNVQVERMRLALLKDLPISGSGTALESGLSAQQLHQQLQQQLEMQSRQQSPQRATTPWGSAGAGQGAGPGGGR